MEVNFPKLEKRILKFWEKNRVFEKSIEQRKKAKDFVFYEGPPTANAEPGLHHVLSRVFKDIICRYKIMRGFRVLRKAGWDTHGLPVELEIEKKLGFKSKKDIEKFGIKKFNNLCKKSVWKYKKEWEKLTERIGFWLDLKNPYITYSSEYIESVWFLLKKIWEKGLLYQDFKVSPYCPRCQTVLSSHEVAQGYRTIKEPAIYVKFEILNPEFENTSLLIWTTTPWTLPGNVAVAINPNFIYSQIKIGEEYLILAKERVKNFFGEVEIKKEFLGKDLIGLKYQPPFDFYQPNYKKVKIWEVLAAEFVSLKEGTGLVHIAPAFGEEDLELIKLQNVNCKLKDEAKFPILINVDEEGKFKEEIKSFARMFVKEADPLIIKDLKERGLLFKEEIYEHDYPFCWRCNSPLLYYAKKSWFIRMSALKEKLIKNNQKINWIPKHLKEGRFGEWLREIKDWTLSRERYWGTPLSLWQCQNCQHQEVIGSKKDLFKQKFTTNKYFILRHGESVPNVEKFHSSWPEPRQGPLTEKGRKKIEKLTPELKKIKIDLIFSSDVLRASQTAEIISQALNIKIKYDKRLREVNVGTLNGKSIQESKNYFNPEGNLKEEEVILKKFTQGFPEGENYFEVGLRMLNFIKETEKKHKNKNILIVSHEVPLKMLQAFTRGWEEKEIIAHKKELSIQLGELRELEYKAFPYNQEGRLDFHRPYIDEIEFFCPKCSGLMKRVPEVIDCWFDSGSMPFAQGHWPFVQNQKSKIKNQKLKPPKLFPADYISEGIDQTRGWFYTLLAISTLLDFGPPYKNVISLGHVLDEKGEKMSKSKGNVVDPWMILENYGADALRWYFFTINQPSDQKLFSENDVKESFRKFILTFFNCFLFFDTYAKKSKIENRKSKIEKELDKWIISRLNYLVLKVTQSLEKYDITRAGRAIEDFVINDLSLWYIRRSRRKFQRPESEKELKEASQVLGFVLLTLSKLLAPFLPFLSEFIYQKIQNLEFKALKSVHLEDWPKVNKKLINKDLEKKMEIVREIVAQVLKERAKLKIKVRQPLNELQIKNLKLRKEKELLNLIKEEVNVKNITFGKSLKLDTEITPELKEEGILREIIRQIQEMRKEMGLKPNQKIVVEYKGEKDLIQILAKKQKFIEKEAKLKSFQEKIKEKISGFKKEIEINGEKLILFLRKI